MRVEYIDGEFKELIPIFLINKRKEIDALRSLCAQQDFSNLSYMGHRIKGSAENYGFSYIVEVGRLLEYYSGTKDLDSIQTLIESFESYLDEVEIRYVTI